MPLKKSKVSIYEPIWQKLKRDGYVAITAMPSLHARIKKAVIKRKDLDLGFKLMCAETTDKKFALLTTESKQSILIFRLHYTANRIKYNSSQLWKL